jgi:hypothetical protein
MGGWELAFDDYGVNLVAYEQTREAFDIMARAKQHGR